MRRFAPVKFSERENLLLEGCLRWMGCRSVLSCLLVGLEQQLMELQRKSARREGASFRYSDGAFESLFNKMIRLLRIPDELPGAQP